ncbi:MAG: T9SS type A sorting domain-containing protein [Sphingobacteriaceae bacterium]|nr:T9SS type A sorting domain-containing protein [Sphingobacteriaceae bacterium]
MVQAIIQSEKKFRTEINFYPNPFNGSLKVNSNETDFEIEITDVIGREMIHLGGVHEIETHTWPTGVYLIHYRSDKYDITQKVILGR